LADADEGNVGLGGAGHLPSCPLDSIRSTDPRAAGASSQLHPNPLPAGLGLGLRTLEKVLANFLLVTVSS